MSHSKKQPTKMKITWKGGGGREEGEREFHSMWRAQLTSKLKRGHPTKGIAPVIQTLLLMHWGPVSIDNVWENDKSLLLDT